MFFDHFLISLWLQNAGLGEYIYNMHQTANLSTTPQMITALLFPIIKLLGDVKYQNLHIFEAFFFHVIFGYTEVFGFELEYQKSITK